MATIGQAVRLNRIVGNIPAGTVGSAVRINLNKALVKFPEQGYPSTWVSKDWLDWDLTAPFVEQETAAATHRRLAVTIALNTYLSNWGGLSTGEILISENQPNAVEVWEPFENHEWYEVMGYVDDLAAEIENSFPLIED